MTTITFKVPGTKPRGRKVHHYERSGKVAWLTIGERKVKFVLQGDHRAVAGANPKADAVYLTHHASGMIFGKINDLKIRHMCAAGHNAILTDREAAEKLIAEKLALLGPEKILAVLDAAEVINS
ncbi:hypothetical protein [Bradyrhizobium sp. 2S1]|uniref:hypothetical protein n=1 Tax=Bradyrhizobium sp. 2S1 TaxID=1404429 RepID=UPI001409A21A|nr:hypothetical protein [Bradyrhizobium sp. 2S1]MCK7669160.1 hypothetical protein [Bradyrhizobium sp. 2S1]